MEGDLSQNDAAAAQKPGVSAIVTAYRRPRQALITLRNILACDPPPLEVLVHVDGNETATAAAIVSAFPDIRLILSAANVGPGGGRNKLIAACRGTYVISFDDDSYPLDSDFCDRVVELFEAYPRAAVLAADVFHQGEEVTEAQASRPRSVDSFPGCGCAYRRSMYLTTTGYVPLPLAYGMEEVDLALRLIDQGHQILHARALRVSHDTDLARHSDPEVTAASIANIALLAYLRYPLTYWWLGVAQLARRVFWLCGVGRRAGIVDGFAAIPGYLFKHRAYRAPISFNGMRRARSLRRAPEPATGRVSP